MISSREALSRVGAVESETRRQSIGVAVVVVGIDLNRNGGNVSEPYLWTVRELQTKSSTEKFAGQLSFPGETSKAGEGLRDNILGALAGEFSGQDSILPHFYLTPSSHIEGEVYVNENPIDLVILTYAGPLDVEGYPLAEHEVSPNGWMTIEQLRSLSGDGVRKMARDILNLDALHGVIGQVVAEFFGDPAKNIPLSGFLPDNFLSLSEFYAERERLADIEIK